MTITTDITRLWLACLADPADDTPRLVLADAIQGEGDEPRAELLRIQIKVERGNRAAARDEAALLEVHVKKWVPVCPWCDGGHADDITKLPDRWQAMVSCVACGQTRLCPGEWRRGLFHCLVPRIMLGFENSRDVKQAAGGMVTVHQWQPTTWAMKAAEQQLAVFSPPQAKPYHNGYGWSWFKKSRSRPSPTIPGAAILEDPIFNAMDGNVNRGGGRFHTFAEPAHAYAALSHALAKLSLI